MFQRHYFVRNATLNVDALELMLGDVTRNIWPVEAQLYDEGSELVSCVVFTVEFRHVRVHGKPIQTG